MRNLILSGVVDRNQNRYNEPYQILYTLCEATQMNLVPQKGLTHTFFPLLIIWTFLTYGSFGSNDQASNIIEGNISQGTIAVPFLPHRLDQEFTSVIPF